MATWVCLWVCYSSQIQSRVPARVRVKRRRSVQVYPRAGHKYGLVAFITAAGHEKEAHEKRCLALPTTGARGSQRNLILPGAVKDGF